MICSAPRFTVTTRSASSVVQVSGTIDTSSVWRAACEITAAMDAPGDWTLDLSGLTQLDEAGARMLVQLALGVNGRVHLVNPPSKVRGLLEVAAFELQVGNVLQPEPRIDRDLGVVVRHSARRGEERRALPA